MDGPRHDTIQVDDINEALKNENLKMGGGRNTNKYRHKSVNRRSIYETYTGMSRGQAAASTILPDINKKSNGYNYNDLMGHLPEIKIGADDINDNNPYQLKKKL